MAIENQPIDKKQKAKNKRKLRKLKKKQEQAAVPDTSAERTEEINKSTNIPPSESKYNRYEDGDSGQSHHAKDYSHQVGEIYCRENNDGGPGKRQNKDE